jgi:filamentous hemagglutinin
MPPLARFRGLFVLALALFALAAPLGSAQKLAPKADKTFGRPHIDAVEGAAKVLDDVKVLNFGKKVYEGKVDVNPTLERIKAGKKYEYKNDGAFFGNREGLLPKKKDKDYYREFVHHFKGLPFPGPQRVVIGKEGEVYYTPDHYSSFKRVR